MKGQEGKQDITYVLQQKFNECSNQNISLGRIQINVWPQTTIMFKSKS